METLGNTGWNREVKAKQLVPLDELAVHQLVGEVNAYQGDDGQPA